MIDKRTWQEFSAAGLLWWANRILHLFGWAIVLQVESDGTISDVYPARCTFRGFVEETEHENFKKLSAYLKTHIEEIDKEAQDG
jgi:hypothetical protein